MHNPVHDVDRYAHMHKVLRIYNAMHMQSNRSKTCKKCPQVGKANRYKRVFIGISYRNSKKYRLCKSLRRRSAFEGSGEGIALEKQPRLGKQFFDWMGVVLAVSLFALSAAGAWSPLLQPVVQNLPAQTDSGGVPLIVLDAGHGGKDGGASGVSGVEEAGINLEVARLVESGLREAGFAVVMTRKNEDALAETKRADMEARREIMRSDGACAVVSIHMNKFRDSSIKGPMAFYMKDSVEGEKLATQVITAVCETIGHPKRPANPGDYFVLRESIAPAVIIECGFLSNASDEEKLQDPAHQKKLAAGIVAGIAAYFAMQQGVTPAPVTE